MNKIISSLFIASALLCNAAFGAEWVKMKGYISPLSGTYVENEFYDAETIKREGNFVTAWTRNINFGLSRTDVYFMKRYFDCGNQRYQILYTRQTGQINQTHDFANNRQWITIDIDDALNMNTARRICALYGMKP